MMKAAIAKARQRLESVLKEEERDAEGRWTSGDGGPPAGSHMEQQAKDLVADTKATAAEAKATGDVKALVPKEVGDRMATHYQLTGEHEDAATLHEQLAGYAERAGNKELAAAHKTAAELHDRAATLHSYAVRDLNNASGHATAGFGGANYTGRAAAAAAASNDAAVATMAADRTWAKTTKSLGEELMRIDDDLMAQAIAKARQDLAPMLKEWDEDKHPRGEGGRFGSSGGSSGGKYNSGSGRNNFSSIQSRAERTASATAKLAQGKAPATEAEQKALAAKHLDLTERSDKAALDSHLTHEAGAHKAGDAESVRLNQAAQQAHSDASTANYAASRSIDPSDSKYDPSSYPALAQAAADATSKAAAASAALAAHEGMTKSVEIEESEMVEAIIKARADLALVLKEEERDDRGRWTSGGESADARVAAGKAKDLAENMRSTNGDLSAKELRGASDDHKDLAAQHRDLANQYRSASLHEAQQGDDGSSRIYSTAAAEHTEAARAHETASADASARAGDVESGKSVSNAYERSSQRAASLSDNAFDVPIK